MTALALPRSESWTDIAVHTIGHSTRTLDEVVTLLRAFDIAIVADVRTIPRSLRNPQFGGDALRRSLRSRRLRYVHIPELGGLRRARKDSPNGACRNASFRGYADHTATAEFESGLTKLRALAAEGRVALLCAEAVPWRCHRSLIADVLAVRGAHVVHILGSERANAHRVTEFARIVGSRVVYPPEALAHTTVSQRRRPRASPAPLRRSRTTRT